MLNVFLCYFIGDRLDVNTPRILKESLPALAKQFVLFILLVSLAALPFAGNVSTKLLPIAGIISCLCVISNPRLYFKKSPLIIIFLSLIALGLMNLIWATIFKGHSAEFINAYRGPTEFGKVALFSAFIFLALLTNDQNEGKKFSKHFFLGAALFSQVLFFAYGAWQHFVLHMERVSFATEFATTASYIFMFSAIFTGILIIKNGGKYCNLLFVLNLFISLSTIFMTGTRGAILVFPILYLCIILLNFVSTKKINYKLIFLSVIIFIVAALAFKNVIESRANNLNQDMTNYSQNDSDSSVGARLAMYESGLRTYSFWGQSLETRSEKIHALAKVEPRLDGALVYLDAHLHNDIIETLSTRGVPGVLLVLFFYLAFAYYIVFVLKDFYLLILLAAPAVLSVSDVILFSRICPSALMIVLLLMCVYSQNRMIK